jgi:hypothetical protein
MEILRVPALLVQVDEACSNATSQLVESDPVKPGELWVVEKVLAYDPDNTVTSFDLFIRRGGLNFRVDRYVPAAATNQHQFDGPLYVPEGCAIGVGFNAATLTDRLQVTLNGYWLK